MRVSAETMEKVAHIARRSRPAWERTYRALEHGRAKNRRQNRAAMNLFPTAIRDFGDHFVDMQRYRHHADYAPVTDFERSWVAYVVEQTERIINRFNKAPAGDRRAFAPSTFFSERDASDPFTRGELLCPTPTN